MNVPAARLLRAPLLALALAAAAAPVRADERILSYHSDITVETNADVVVTETIRVRAEGDQIRRGIFRDFPTKYRDRFGNRVQAGFTLLGVQRDGQPEAHHTEMAFNGVKIYAGSENVLLPPGEYTYTFSYRTDWQLGFFEKHDELYWNVTGNGWSFPIDQASATVTLPESIPSDGVTFEGYTGPQGSQETELRAERLPDGRLHYETTRPLMTGEGLTIVATWPKGHVQEPTPAQRAKRLFGVNRSFLAGLAGLGALLAYYLTVWVAVGVDPAKGVIIPQFKPPDGISPAAARFIREMGYDNKCFAAGVISLAVQGALRIHQDKKTFRVERAAAPGAKATRDEVKLFEHLLGPRQSLTFTQTQHSVIGKAVRAFKTALSTEFEKEYFLKNRLHWLPGIFIAAASAVGVALLGPQKEQALFLGVWLTFWSVGVMALLYSAGTAWKASLGPGGSWLELPGALFTTLFAIPFVAAEGFVLFLLAQATSPLAALCLAAIGLTLWLFYVLLKAPTLLGRRILDHLDGLRLYMSVAEEDRLRMLHPPQKTPEHFEALLPYALALDVEQEWARQFAGVLESASQSPAAASTRHTAYSPGWYRGPSGKAMAAGMIAGALGGALSSAISSSSTPPGSSSGSGGGGSSGGGGGGGGGGGW